MRFLRAVCSSCGSCLVIVGAEFDGDIACVHTNVVVLAAFQVGELVGS